jgi:hypothetical protein
MESFGSVAAAFQVCKMSECGAEANWAVPPSIVARDPEFGRGFELGTYLGGSGYDHYGEEDLALGPDGSIYVAGTTFSMDFPTTPGAYDTTGDEAGDVFVARLDPTGSTLLYSTYLGGTGFDVEHFLAVGSDGSAYVSGTTASSDFPTTPGSFDPTYNGGDGFITKLEATGSKLAYSTFLGGTSPDEVDALAVAGDGTLYVTGQTASDDFPTSPAAFDRTLNGEDDVFVAALTRDGRALAYSTYLGGIYNELGLAIAIGSDGTAYVSGFVQSYDFPTTAGAYDQSFNGGNNDLFVTHLNTNGSALLYSTYIGGDDVDTGWDIAVDPVGNTYVTGYTGSATYPTTPGAYDRTINSHILTDVFATKLNASGSVLVYSTFLGGSNTDDGLASALDPKGGLIITGHTQSADFPVTPTAFQPIRRGPGDAFVSRFDPTGAHLTYSTYLGGGGGFIDDGGGIGIVHQGTVIVGGWTAATNFPTTAEAYDRTFNGGSDVFVATLRIAPRSTATSSARPIVGPS